jgi:AcrR family transcriptional regulator
VPYARQVSDQVRDGRSTRWDPHRRERRAAITAAAVTAIEQYGPDALTGQIADLAGVPRTHVYRHFEGKQALDRAVVRRAGREILAQIRNGLATGDTPREIISGGLSGYLGWIELHPNLYRFLAKHAFTIDGTGLPMRDDAKAILAVELTTVLAGYMRAMGLDDAAAERTITGVVGLIDNTALWWLSAPETPRADLTDWLTKQVWLLIDSAVREQGLEMDPDDTLPTPQPAG